MIYFYSGSLKKISIFAILLLVGKCILINQVFADSSKQIESLEDSVNTNKDIDKYTDKHADKAIDSQDPEVNSKFTTNVEKARKHFNKALELLKKGRQKSAVGLLNLAIRLNPKYVDAYILRASIHKKSGNLRSALVDYTHALNIRPTDKILYERGVVELALKAYPEAARDFTTAIEANPKFARAYNGRGMVFLASNLLEEAKNDFMQAFSLNNNLVSALEKIGDINTKQANFEEALANFNQLVELKPKYANAYLKRGKVLEALQMHEQALQDYNKGIALNKNSKNINILNEDNDIDNSGFI